MPNYCHNRLEFSKNVDLTPYINKGDCQDALDYNKIIPCDAGLENTDEAIKAWGNRWNDAGIEGMDENSIWFFSAWSPVVPVAKKLSEIFQCVVTITYYEPGMCFAGVAVCNNGKVNETEYDGDSFMYKQIAESFGDVEEETNED